MTQLSFKQDVDIWHNKFRVDNPLLCDGDGPLHKLREWYDQFYVDRGDLIDSLIFLAPKIRLYLELSIGIK